MLLVVLSRKRRGRALEVLRPKDEGQIIRRRRIIRQTNIAYEKVY